MRIKISEIKEGSITPIPGTDCFAVKTGEQDIHLPGPVPPRLLPIHHGGSAGGRRLDLHLPLGQVRPQNRHIPSAGAHHEAPHPGEIQVRRRRTHGRGLPHL